ncbi:MAG: ABC transporter ATP-binding protein [Anaerolineales bacterium]|nr:ABC transporter ATP-binding protein [Anaerolineales bacterium]
MTDNHTFLEVKDLKTRFHTPEGTVFAVNGVSFSLKEGETLAVVGESGCGKSVTMMSLLRLISIPPGKIESGEVIYRDKDLLKLTESEMEHIRGKEIAMIFQDPMTSLNPVLTVGRQLTETLRTHTPMNPDQCRERAITLLDWVGIPDAKNRLNDHPHQFSGGMRQRVMIAMALACTPSLLIADEPTTALDVTIQAQIIELVKRLKQDVGMAMIWITHDLGVVAGMADRVIVMYAGFIVEEALVDDLYDNPLHPYTMALLQALPRADRRREKNLKSIQGSPPNLLAEPVGCPFAPRCEFVKERCVRENPILTEITGGHKTACWVDVKTGGLR